MCCLLVACQKPPVGHTPPVAMPSPEAPQPPEPPALPERSDNHLINSQEVAPDFAALNNRLALGLLAASEKWGEENVFFSPMSLATATGMLYAGAGPESQAGLERFFGWSAAALPQMRLAEEQLMADSLRMGRKIWAQTGLYPTETFFERMGASSGERSGWHTSVDFRQKAEAVGQINTWVAQLTEGKIDKLLSTQDIGPQTVMALLTAVYFKGMWEHPFDPAKTVKGKFMLEAGHPVETDFMRQTLSAQVQPIAEGSRILAVALPFSGAFDLLAFNGPPDSVRHILQTDQEAMQWALALGRKQEGKKTTDLLFPKISLAFKKDLASVWQEAGLQNTFAPPASFPHLTRAGEGVLVEKVIHAAHLTLDETGVTAAAATAVIMGRSINPGILRLRFDEPFLFLIVHRRTGLIAFAGVLKNPEVGR